MIVTLLCRLLAAPFILCGTAASFLEWSTDWWAKQILGEEDYTRVCRYFDNLN